MKSVYNFGKISCTSLKGRKLNEVTLKLELRGEEDKPVFSVCCDVWNSRHTDIVWGGQCVDEVYNGYKEQLQNRKLYEEIMDLWKKYHLSDMHAGTEEQEQLIEEWKAQGNRYDYTEVCEYLKSIGKYEVEYEGKPYKYGHGWLYREIPEKDLARIKELVSVA